jgi:hypothetical protein
MADEFIGTEGQSGFADIQALSTSEDQLQNVVLSHRPCPDCQAANGQIMTYTEWENSEYGLPGSSGRICLDDCHCCLVPVDVLPDLAGINDRAVKLRGDEGSDIRGIVDIGPHEDSLKQDMEEWYLITGEKLPPEIYDMPFDEIGPYMKKVLAARRSNA